MEGSRWITRAASSLSVEHTEIRAEFIHHAAEEQRDFQMIERDYVAVGGDLEEILGASKNVGSEALSAYMFQEASKPDPIHLLGAMYIIEGLGARKAARWADLLVEQLDLSEEQVTLPSVPRGRRRGAHQHDVRDASLAGRHSRHRPGHREDGQGRRPPLRAPAGGAGQCLNRGRWSIGPGPGIFDALRGDPSLYFDRDALRLLELDQSGFSHRFLRPFFRVGSRVVVALIVFVKRLLPFEFSNHDLLDRLGVWFLSRFVSRHGGELLLCAISSSRPM